GFLFADHMKTKAGHEYMARLLPYFGTAGKPAAPRLPEDGKLTFDKLTDVYSSGTVHEEDQPCHLVVTEPDLCSTRCGEEFGSPATSTRSIITSTKLAVLTLPASAQPNSDRCTSSSCGGSPGISARS